MNGFHLRIRERCKRGCTGSTWCTCSDKYHRKDGRVCLRGLQMDVKPCKFGNSMALPRFARKLWPDFCNTAAQLMRLWPERHTGLTPTITAAGSAKESRPSSFSPMCRRSLVKDEASANSRSICATGAGGVWMRCVQEARSRGTVQERARLAVNPASASSESHSEIR